MGSAAADKQVVINICGSYVKWVMAREAQGKTFIEHVRYKKFDNPADEDISLFLVDCFNEFKLHKRSAICALPSNLYISKNVDMPSNDPDEIRNIINLHAGRYTPYAREEIVIDYLTSQAPEQHYTNVLLLIVNRNDITRFFKVFNDAIVDLEKIVVSAEATALLFEKWQASKGDETAIAGITIDYEMTDLTIADRNKLVFIRNIPAGAKDLLENPKEMIPGFVEELRQSFATYQDQGVGRPIERMVMTGLMAGDAALEGEVRSLIPRISISNVQFKVIPYLERFQLSKEVQKTLAEDPNLCLLDVFSVLAQKNQLKVDLTPEEVKLQHKVREGGRTMVSFGIIVMTCLLIMCFFLATKLYLKNTQISKIEALSDQSTALARSLEKASTKTRVLRELLGTRGKGLYIFDKMISVLGDDIYLVGFSYDRDGSVTISGTADSMSKVYALVTRLEESEFFQNVETKQTKTRKEQGKEVADFEIACKFEEVKDSGAPKEEK